MILVDTKVIVAAADSSDINHRRRARWLTDTDNELGFPATVLAETCYLLDRFGGPDVEARFLDSVGAEPGRRLRLLDLVEQDVRRMGELVRQYADRRLGGTDASLVALAERLNVTTVATVNRRDFDNVRPRHVAALTVVPE